MDTSAVYGHKSVSGLQYEAGSSVQDSVMESVVTFAAGQVKEACHDMKGTARDLEDAMCKVADAAVPSDVAEVFRNAKEAARAFSNVLGANGERLDNAFTAVEMSQKIRGEMANKAPPKSKYTPSPSRGPPSPAPSRSTSWTPSRRVVTPKDGTTGSIISGSTMPLLLLGSLSTSWVA